MLYLIRHGVTDWNEQRKLQGGTNIPLNERGRQMAREACEKYKDVKFDVCFSSPLDRATETAKIFIGDRDLNIEIDERLREISFGADEGIERCDTLVDHPIHDLFYTPERYVPINGGETLEQLIERTGAFLKEKVYPLLEQGKNVLIVGHGAMNSSIICNIKGLEKKDFWNEPMKNCQLLEFEYPFR